MPQILECKGPALAARISELAKDKLGITPYPWQLASACKMIQGEKLLVKAGTAAGKTVAMALATLAFDSGFALILSPLIALQTTQVSCSRGTPHSNADYILGYRA